MIRKSLLYRSIQHVQWLLAAFLLVGIGLSAWGVGNSKAATTINVTSFEDKINTDGFCSLREAIIAANKDNANGNPGECPAGSGADIIVLPAGTYNLDRTDNGKEDSSSTGDLDISSDITIQGEGGKVVINAIPGFKDRIFHVLAGTSTFSNLTIQGGIPGSDGGGIYNAGTLTLTNVTLSGNNAPGNGGGIYNAGTLTLTNVTLSGNNANLSGGGLYNTSTTGTATLKNVTISANIADKDSNGTGDGGGVARQSGTIGLSNTLIGGNSDGSAANKQQPDCSGSLASQGYNLIQNMKGCSLTGTSTGNQTGVDPKLGPLADNGGLTFTHALLSDSPAIDKGNPAAPGSSSSACATTDQRGLARPQGAACDIGAFEVEDPLQTGPIYTVIAVVGSNDDRDDGACTFSHCSLREAIQAANARPNGAAPDEIKFNLSGGSTINVTSTLPPITSPVIIDGTTQPGGTLVLNGSGAGANVNGLTVSGGGSTLKGLTIRQFSCNGILLTTNGGNTIQNNTITQNGCDGIRVQSGANNRLTANLISANGMLGIDLGGDGPTSNDTGDLDGGANNLQNYPVLFGADPYIDSANGKTVIDGRLNGPANTAYTLEFFSNQTCDASGYGEAETFLGSASATTDIQGDAYFKTSFSGLPADRYVSVTATSPSGDTSELSACKRVDARNDSWPAALQLNLPQNGSPALVNQYLDQQGQSRWYYFKIQPNSQLVVTLTGLPANYDLTLYKDINQAYKEITGTQDLVRLGAEFAADAFNADGFSSDAFNADAFSPQAFSPQAFSPQAFSPQAFSPQAFSPQAFSPQAFSPDAFLADAYSPQAFSPQAFSPQAFSPQAFSPQAFSPQAFSNAQTRSLIGVSAFDGTAGEGLAVNTWDNTGNFYIRVRGRNGAFDPSQKFHMEVAQITGDCASINTNLPATSLTGVNGGYHTLIVTDFGRLDGSADAQFQQNLADFTARSEVRGTVVDVSQDARVVEANRIADAGNNYLCPFYKNQVAYAVKSVIDNYRAKNPLEYIVIIGNDNVIPFFRHADQAMLANEKNYAPPVKDDTASQASLKLGYVLSQDRYGTDLEISHKDESFPIPDLAVGRLVETATDATHMLEAYLKTNGGVMPTPTKALVTGYDFLVDNAEAVRDDLVAGMGPNGAVDASLITPPNLSPEDTSDQVWTADDLRAKLFGTRHDLIYLAGHFSASGALAADFSTNVASSELLSSTADLENALIYSAGCHSGYNIVDPHGVPFVTREPDWAQAANSQGITLIAGTGYQYGDTDFIEYSERLYLDFTRQLRAGSGKVPIGKALVEAKQQYLADTPQLRGIHEKALLEATLFGFPMFAVDMPGQRYTPDGDNTLAINPQTYASNPGASLGLEYADVAINPSLERIDTPLKNVEDNTTVSATYLIGKNGVITNPVEPVLPAEVYNASLANTVLRGVGFKGGDYTDLANILPLIGAATTEVRGVHSPFVTEFFYPVRLWSVNYLDALVNGPTRLVVTPAHFKLNEGPADRGTLRQFDSLNLRLFYSDYGTASTDKDDAALSAAPSIVRVTGTPAGDSVDFQMRVVGNPAAGIQEVWVTYTSIQGSFYGKWQSLDLTQNPLDSTLWEGSLSLPQDVLPEEVRYVVQAVNGVGLVAFDTNQGAFHTPRFENPPTLATSLALVSPATSGPYGTQVEFTAQMTGSDQPQFLTFSLGPQSRRVLTGTDGRATASLSLLGIPGDYQVKVAFPGTSEYIASKAESGFTITKQSTTVKLDPLSATAALNLDTGITATVTDATGRRLVEKTVFFVLEGSNGAASKAVITDYIGRASLGSVSLPRGTYTVTAYFGGENIPLRTNGTVTPVTFLDERYTPSSDTSSLTIINRAPLAGDDAYPTDEDTALDVPAPGVLGNDSDPDGDSLSAVLASGPAHGTLVLNPDGSFTYTPQANFNGSDSFTYQATDGGNSTLATVTITVNPINDVPVASDLSIFTNEDTPVTITLQVTDADGDPLSYTVITPPQNGTLSGTGPALTYTPNPEYSGADSFTYLANDGKADSNLATINITVNAVNDNPVCTAANALTDPPTYLGDLALAWPPNSQLVNVNVIGVTDPENDPVTITFDSIFQDEPVGKKPAAPDGFILGINTAQVRAERDQNANGRVYHLHFTASDGFGGSCSSQVLVGVPSDQGGTLMPVDDGELYDSTKLK